MCCCCSVQCKGGSSSMVWFKTHWSDRHVQWKMKQRIFSCPCEAFRFRCWVLCRNKGGTVTWDKRRGWEGVWLRDKLWCTMEVLIFDRSSDLLKLPRGLGFRLPEGLPSPCLLRSLSLFLSLSPAVPASLFHCYSLFHCLPLSLCCFSQAFCALVC